MAAELYQNIKQRYISSVFVPWSKQEEIEPLNITHAKGVYLTLDTGERLLDFKSQNFSANLGHKHEGMLDAITKASKNITVLASESICPMRLELAEELLALAPGYKKVFFTLGGAEANENAIKMARLFSKKQKVITRYRSYHGSTLSTINFSGDYRRIPIDNGQTGVVRFPDPYPKGSGQHIDTVRLLEEIIEIEGPETICAVLLEGITGANGVFIPPNDYWPRIRKLCDDNDILLIADEVLSGFYRTGKCFAFEHFGIKPDMVTMSKGMTAGYAPLGGVLVNQKVSEFFNNNTLWCGLTQYGHYISCATSLAAINNYKTDNVVSNVTNRGVELAEFLAELKSKYSFIGEVRSIGLLAAIDLIDPKTNKPITPYRATGENLRPSRLLQKILRNFGLSALVRFSSIILAPPLIISQHELKEGLINLDKALAEWKIAENSY